MGLRYEQINRLIFFINVLKQNQILVPYSHLICLNKNSQRIHKKNNSRKAGTALMD